MKPNLKISVLGLLGLAASASTLAQSPLQENMHGCMQMSDSLQRLHCFEQLTRRSEGQAPAMVASPQAPAQAQRQTAPSVYASEPAPAVTHQQSQATVRSWNPQKAITSGLMPGTTQVGDWEVTVSGNPVSGAHDVKLRLKSTSGLNQYAAPIGLVVECKNGQAAAKMIWDEYLVKDVAIAVKLDGRLDEAATRGWRLTKDLQDWWMSEADVRPMLNALKSHSTMTTVAKSYETSDNDEDTDGSIRAEWNLAGTEFALKPFYALCGS